jgi:hypothetical protein
MRELRFRCGGEKSAWRRGVNSGKTRGSVSEVPAGDEEEKVDILDEV